jgi:hypothetical protein
LQQPVRKLHLLNTTRKKKIKKTNICSQIRWSSFCLFPPHTPHSPCLTTVVQQHVRKPHLLNTTRMQKIKRNQYTLCLSLHKLEMVSLKPMMQTLSNPPSHTTLTLIWTQCWQGAFLRAPVSLMKDHHTVILHLMQRGIK